MASNEANASDQAFDNPVADGVRTLLGFDWRFWNGHTIEMGARPASDALRPVVPVHILQANGAVSLHERLLRAKGSNGETPACNDRAVARCAGRYHDHLIREVRCPAMLPLWAMVP